MPTVISAKQFRKELRLPARTDFHHPSVLCAGKGNLLFPSALLNIVIILANEDFLVNSFGENILNLSDPLSSAKGSSHRTDGDGKASLCVLAKNRLS